MPCPFEAEKLFQHLEGAGSGHEILYVPQLNQAVIAELRKHFDAIFKPCIVSRGNRA